MQWLSYITNWKKLFWNCHTAGYEPFNWVEDCEKVPDRKHLWSTRAWKKAECPLPSIPQKHEGKAATKPSPKLQTLATVAGVSKSTMHQVLRGDLDVKLFKMLHYQELNTNHVALRAQKSKEILPEMTNGTLPNLVFMDEKNLDIQQVVNQQKLPSLGILVIHWEKNRFQTPKSAVSHGLGGRHRDRKVPSALGALWSQIEPPSLHRRHFGGLSAVLGQEALPWSFLVLATGLCVLSRFQDHRVLDSKENSLIHKQGSLACKEHWPCLSGLLQLVNPRDQPLFLSQLNSGSR